MDVLRRSARKWRRERIKNEHTKEIMGVRGTVEGIERDSGQHREGQRTAQRGTADSIEKKRLQWCGHVKRIPEERIPKLITEWIPLERRERGRPRKTWMEGVKAVMTTRNLEPDQWRNREEWRLVCGRRRQLL
jgi:hypothetical protein